MMGQAPFAGMAWQVLHYVEGLRRLGFEVFYVEDTGAWPYDPEQNAITADCQYAAAYIAKVLGWCGLGDHWAYRSPAQDSATFGLSISQLARLYNGADVLVNLTGATVLRDEQLKVPVRIYLETDPVLPQIETAQGRQFTIDLLSAHTHHFTFGENLGASDCKVPLGRFTYQSTRQPVVLDWWELPDISSPELMANGRFTTIANWKQTSKDVEWDGQIYKWSKHEEFLKFIALPQRTTQPLELALASNDHEAMRRLQEYGWHLRDALVLSRELLPYRAYIGQSRGEFTVAKDQYVRLRSGWFSDRSACYLAAGRPVITQETGFSKFFPTGKGLFAFQTMEDILAAVDAINSDCQGNCRAAREIAAEYFTAEKVLGSLMERAGC
jgi:hypothetical protein